jgi:hypothetical protein
VLVPHIQINKVRHTIAARLVTTTYTTLVWKVTDGAINLAGDLHKIVDVGKGET